MLHHTFNQDLDDTLCAYSHKFISLNNALLDNGANQAVGIYLEAHAELRTYFSVEFFGNGGDKVLQPFMEEEFHMRSLKKSGHCRF